MAKTQRTLYGSICKSKNRYLFQDANGKLFDIPELNKVGTPLYRRVKAAANHPEKWMFKMHWIGSLKDGSVGYQRVLSENVPTNYEPFINFKNLTEFELENTELGNTNVLPKKVDTFNKDIDISKFIHTEAVSLRPNTLIMPDLKWKYLIRCIMRGENILMTGPSGTAKSVAATIAARSIPNRKFHKINLGSTQDPRTVLIGNTQYDINKGTVFNRSAFVEAISTPNTTVLLDELSRAHPEAHNILMSVLDPNQRYLRLDEAANSPVVEVADGVSFVATANIGTEYTATRKLDRAIQDRFSVEVEMEFITQSEEFELLKLMFPTANKVGLKAISQIASSTRTEYMDEDDGKLGNYISTRTSVKMAQLLMDGFSVEEIAEVTVYPKFDASGGTDSERTFVKQLVQRFLPMSDDDTADDTIVNQPNTTKASKMFGNNPNNPF